MSVRKQKRFRRRNSKKKKKRTLFRCIRMLENMEVTVLGKRKTNINDNSWKSYFPENCYTLKLNWNLFVKKNKKNKNENNELTKSYLR